MASSFDKTSSDIFNSASSKIRLQVLRLLDSKGPLPYTEIMFSLKLDPVRDAGKFVYHLKNLMEPGLIIVDKDKKKYSITDLGKLIIGFSKDLEEYVAVKKGKLFVRTSKFSIEEFDKEKIANSLITEAKIPYDLAKEIATEAKDRLIQLKTAYLTAPLIREFVNAILIEKGLDEYRHKLTRLGMPVYDVSQLFKTTGEKGLNAENIFYSSGSSVLEEYALLTSLSRDIADSHLSGSIHIDDLIFWPLKPKEIQHDIRFFFSNGALGIKNPKTFEGALEILKIAYDAAKKEISGEQGIDMFNIFLAPFVRSVDREQIKEALKLLFIAVYQNGLFSEREQGLSLCLELGVPNMLSDVKAIGPGEKTLGVYGDYEDEVILLFNITIEIFTEFAQSIPLTNPRLIIKLRKEILDKGKFRKELRGVYELIGKTCLPYLSFPGNNEANYLASGLRLSDEWSKEWESDCVRTGNMATIFINLPRMVYEARGNEEKFLGLLDSSLYMVRKAFIEKRRLIQKRFTQNLLPFLNERSSNNQYFNENNATYTFSFVGLDEAVKAYTNSGIHKEEGFKFGTNIIQRFLDYSNQFSEESELRFVVAQNPNEFASTRLAELDIENYGIANIKISGSKGCPYYTDLPTVPLTSRVPLNKRLEVEGKFQSLLSGGHLALICLKSKEHSTKAIYELVKKMNDNNIKFSAFVSEYTYCKKCDKIFPKFLTKCLSCNSNFLKHYSRASSIFKPLHLWSKAKRRVMKNRIHYSP